MKLKQITKLLFAILIVYGLSSCNSDSTDYTATSASSDAQIYSFKISAKPYTKEDTINYPIMANTRFSIDQFKASIYNTDSLPYKTTLRNVYASVGFGSSSPSKLQVIYPDSIVDWNGTDSLDFSTVPKIKVTAADGSASIEYSIDVRIHKVDPDTLTWSEIKTLEQASSIKKQKTLLIDNKTFYTFSIDTDNKLYLHSADKATAYKPRVAISGLDANKIRLESITYFNNQFYAVDTDNKAYSADKNGLVWNKNQDNIVNIVGILPATNSANDILLVIAKSADDLYLARTSDMNNLVYEKNPINENFPTVDFTSATNYDRTNINSSILAVTGGKDQNNTISNLTWSVQLDDNNAIRVISNQRHSVFAGTKGIVTFLYDSYLYALVNNQFYKSASYGSKWTTAPNKEVLDSKIPKASQQSVIVDEDNYIWIFGGIKDTGGASVQSVWRGRLNKLNPKN